MNKHPFEYQKPTDEQVAALERVRLAMKQAYEAIKADVPPSAEQTLAIRKLEEASFWANKSIVFGGERYL